MQEVGVPDTILAIGTVPLEETPSLYPTIPFESYLDP